MSAVLEVSCDGWKVMPLDEWAEVCDGEPVLSEDSPEGMAALARTIGRWSRVGIGQGRVDLCPACWAVVGGGKRLTGEPCFHPRSCQACNRRGSACGRHRTGTAGHKDCTGDEAVAQDRLPFSGEAA